MYLLNCKLFSFYFIKINKYVEKQQNEIIKKYWQVKNNYCVNAYKKTRNGIEQQKVCVESVIVVIFECVFKLVKVSN